MSRRLERASTDPSLSPHPARVVIMSQIEPMFILSRMTYIREASSKMYSPVVFALSQLAAETPYSILCSVVFFLLLYYPTGFNTDSTRAGYGFAMILLTELFAVTMCVFLFSSSSRLSSSTDACLDWQL